MIHPAPKPRKKPLQRSAPKRKAPPRKRIAVLPWRMCRTCHRIGTKGRLSSKWDRCNHPHERVGECGQCGKRRPLVECHKYDFTARKAPPRKVNRKRKASEFARAYGSKERVEFVKSLPCAACGVVGYSQNAHLLGVEGMGLKKPFETIGPLCGPRPQTYHCDEGYIGCHKCYDEHRGNFDVAFPRFNPEAVAARTEQAWQEHSGGITKVEQLPHDAEAGQ